MYSCIFCLIEKSEIKVKDLSLDLLVSEIGILCVLGFGK